MDGFLVVGEVARSLDVHPSQLPEIHAVYDIGWIYVLPDVVRRVICFLERRVVVEDCIHELPRREASW